MVLYMGLVAFVVLGGASKVDRANYEPFLPFGVSGVFSGSSSIFFSYM
jgi:APA family basic amino acid/polyamine antiporter